MLAAASASASLIFACAAPFAAFAALAVTVLPLRQAVLAVLSAWLVNQAIGFGVLGYPQTFESGAWGLVIGAAAVLATLASAAIWQGAKRFGDVTLYPFVLVGSYAAYELALLSVTPVLGGSGAFSLDIVGRLAFVNAIWMVGLLAAFEALHRIANNGRSGVRT
jgi:hypothetical protein